MLKNNFNFELPTVYEKMNLLKPLRLVAIIFFMSSYFLHSSVLASTLPKVLIITTGGTISAQATEKQLGALPNSEIMDNMQNSQSISRIAQTQIIQFSNMLSESMAPNDWVALAHMIEDSARTLKPDGIVITHGTDTIEETAYFLDLVLNLDIPVVLTGAMRLASERDADGPRNLYRAIQVATSNPPHRIGVVVAFGNVFAGDLGG